MREEGGGGGEDGGGEEGRGHEMTRAAMPFGDAGHHERGITTSVAFTSLWRARARHSGVSFNIIVIIILIIISVVPPAPLLGLSVVARLSANGARGRFAF